MDCNDVVFFNLGHDNTAINISWIDNLTITHVSSVCFALVAECGLNYIRIDKWTRENRFHVQIVSHCLFMTPNFDNFAR